MNDSADRLRWREVRGIDPDMDWFVCCGRSDFASPAGDFAEAFAAWQIGTAGYRSQLSGPPDEAELEVMRQLAAG